LIDRADEIAVRTFQMAGEATQVGKELHVDHRIGQPERFRNLPLQKAHSHAALAAGAHHLENFGVWLL